MNYNTRLWAKEHGSTYLARSATTELLGCESEMEGKWWAKPPPSGPLIGSLTSVPVAVGDSGLWAIDTPEF